MTNKIYGYCRISTARQNLERQERNIKALYPNAIIVQDTYTGTKLNRPNFNKLINKVMPGDTIVFDSVSRFSRNAQEGFELYEKLYNQDITLVFLKEPTINTETYRKALTNSITLTGGKVDLILEGVNAYLMELAKEQIKVAFNQAEKEVQDLHQRTSEGMATAKLNGKQIGNIKGTKLTTKKSVTAKEIIKKHSKTFGGTLTDQEVINLAKISRNSFYKYKKEISEGR